MGINANLGVYSNAVFLFIMPISGENNSQLVVSDIVAEEFIRVHLCDLKEHFFNTPEQVPSSVKALQMQCISRLITMEHDEQFLQAVLSPIVLCLIEPSKVAKKMSAQALTGNIVIIYRLFDGIGYRRLWLTPSCLNLSCCLFAIFRDLGGTRRTPYVTRTFASANFNRVSFRIQLSV